MTETMTYTMHCGIAGCGCSVSITTVRKVTRDGDMFKNALAANDRAGLELAACGIGYRRIAATQEIRCTKHAVDLVCNRCGFEICSCMGGPRFDVRVGDGDDE